MEITQEEIEVIYRAARKNVKRYLKSWIQDTDSEAVDDAVQSSVLWCVKYWNHPKLADCELNKKASMLAVRGFLRSMRDPSASHKVVAVVQNQKRSKRYMRVCRVWGKTNEKAITSGVVEGNYDAVDREIELSDWFEGEQMTPKQRELARCILQESPDTLADCAKAIGISRQSASVLFNDLLYKLSDGPAREAALPGTTWKPDLKKWVARCTIKGKRHIIGYYKTVTEARAAYVNFRREAINNLEVRA